MKNNAIKYFLGDIVIPSCCHDLHRIVRIDLWEQDEDETVVPLYGVCTDSGDWETPILNPGILVAPGKIRKQIIMAEYLRHTRPDFTYSRPPIPGDIYDIKGKRYAVTRVDEDGGVGLKHYGKKNNGPIGTEGWKTMTEFHDLSPELSGSFFPASINSVGSDLIERMCSRCVYECPGCGLKKGEIYGGI
jgi:hypothetical protein